MPIQVFWDNPDKTILTYEFQGDWTWESYYRVLIEGREMMRECLHPVSILNDFRQLTALPRNFVTTARNIIESRPENTALVVFLTTDYRLQSFYKILYESSPIVRKYYILVNTYPEALAKIEDWQNQ